MRRFSGENEAQEYLAQHVPTSETELPIDDQRLTIPLFTASEQPVGQTEHHGPNGLKLSGEYLNVSQSRFDMCWAVLSGLHQTGQLQGDFRPIFKLQHLELSTNRFRFNQRENASRNIEIYWLPDLRATNLAIEHNFAFVDKGQIFLLGDTGRLDAPKKLLSFFHEVGHIASRPLNQLQDEYDDSGKTRRELGRVSKVFSMAQELQRERDANAWMIRSTQALFDDLAIPHQLVRDWVHQQLQSYEQRARALQND